MGRCIAVERAIVGQLKKLTASTLSFRQEKSRFEHSDSFGARLSFLLGLVSLFICSRCLTITRGLALQHRTDHLIVLINGAKIH